MIIELNGICISLVFAILGGVSYTCYQSINGVVSHKAVAAFYSSEKTQSHTEGTGYSSWMGRWMISSRPNGRPPSLKTIASLLRRRRACSSILPSRGRREDGPR